MKKDDKIILSRDVDAISIPFGKKITLPEGGEVIVMQAQGGSVSVGFESRLYLIESYNLDAIGGESKLRPTLHDDATAEELEAFVWEQLRTCYDPEIPVNIVALGLVYGCRIDKLLTGETVVIIKMTLTAPGCGMGDVIAEDARRKILGAPQVSKVLTEIVFNPPWSRDMMSEEAKLETGMF